MDKTIFDLPLSGNLQIIETTEGISGYPNNTAYGIIGYKSFKEAESYAKQRNLEIENLF